VHSNQTSLSNLQDLAGGFAAKDFEVQPASLSGRSRTNLAGERLVLTVAEAGALLGSQFDLAHGLLLSWSPQ
jgi:hypothetical protein